jgi:ribosomal protein S18 acetylase RimI-like enzyme
MKIVRLQKYSREVFEALRRLDTQLSERSSTITPAQVRRLLAAKQSEVFALKDGAVICGMGTIAYAEMLDGRTAHIDDVVVDEAYRGQGLGALLMQQLIERARKRQVIFIELTSRPSRVAANKLYQKIGFALRETNVYRLKF